LVIAGNTLKEEESALADVHGAFKVEELYQQTFKRMEKSIHILDNFFLELSKSLKVDIMAGDNDPSDKSLPQQPLNRAYFPKSHVSQNFCAVTNPYKFQVGDVCVLGTSGIFHFVSLFSPFRTEY